MLKYVAIFHNFKYKVIKITRKIGQKFDKAIVNRAINKFFVKISLLFSHLYNQINANFTENDDL
jgi:hypothetical protein